MFTIATVSINTDNIKEQIENLRIYDKVLLTGYVYTARDAAHKIIVKMINDNERLPFELNGSVIYYAGPTQAPPHLPIGACGPTTSSRMDCFSPLLLDNGLAMMIGKGQRNNEVIEAIKRNNAVYLSAIGGAGALACKCIKSAEVVAFPQLGCESVKRLYVENFPLIVAIDSVGNNVFKNNDTN